MAKKAPKSASKKASKPAPKAVKMAKMVKMVKKPESIVKSRKAAPPRNSNTLSYTYSEFLENIRGFCGLTKRSQAREICEDIAAFVRESLKRGYKLPLLGLGKIYVRKTKARTGRNPATGELIQIPSRKRVRFTPAKALKEAVL